MTDDKTKAAPGIPAAQTVTPPASPPQLGGKQVMVIVGPYRGNALIMPEAEADQAINDHWATELVTTFDPNAEQHPPLSDQERTAAVEAANAWAANVQNPKPPEPPTDPEQKKAPPRQAAPAEPDHDHETRRRR
jgi:hypothetical protein